MRILKKETVFLLGALCIGLAGCGGGDDPPAEHGGGHPLGATAISGDIGQGYDSVMRSIKPMYCIKPQPGTEWAEVGSSSSTLSMALESDRTKIARSLGVDVNASYSIVSASSSFFRSTETDDFSTSYVFGGSISFKERQVGADYVVNPLLATSSPVEWRDYCGDSFIQSTARGSSLYAGMKFHFKSREDKQTFEAKMKVSYGLFTASTALKTAQSVATQGVSVSVSAVQVGGDVTQLNRILNGASASSCSMSDIKKCLEYMDAIEAYASKEFPAQFRDSQGRVLEGGALDRMISTVDYSVRPWSDLVLPGQPNLNSKPLLKQLLDQFSTQFSLQSKVNAIRRIEVLSNRSAAMAEKQAQALVGVDNQINQNIQLLQNAWSRCYPQEYSDCSDLVKKYASQQIAIAPENLVPWFDMLAVNGVIPAHENNLVDINNDGRLEFCYLLDEPTRGRWGCVLTVGRGFEDRPSLFFEGYSDPYAVWSNVAGKGLHQCLVNRGAYKIVCWSVENASLGAYGFDMFISPNSDLQVWKWPGVADGDMVERIPAANVRNYLGQDPVDLIKNIILKYNSQRPNYWMAWPVVE